MLMCYSLQLGAQVAQWVKCWLAEVVGPGLSHAGGRDLFFNHKKGSIAHSLYHPPIVLI